MSLVVPGSSDTIATYYFTILFMMVLLPAFGLPTITKLIPLDIVYICFLRDNIDFILFFIVIALYLVLSNKSAFTSSSSY